MKAIVKTCKVYVKLEKEKIRLYESGTNEATYLMCYLRPVLLEVLKPCSFLKFLWCEASLNCKKRQENEVLLFSDGKSTTTTKIDGIIVDEEFDLEVAIIEVSGPNWKVNTTHFFEDKKKLAKNMKSMYETIIDVKDNPCIVSKKEVKVYGFHVYLNILYVYSLWQPRDGSYIFNLEFKLKLCHRKVIIHSLPALLSHLWLVRDLLRKQHDQLFNYIYENEPSPESSYCGSDAERPNVSPKKKQKTKNV
ncbi:hypothetical protein BD408DRAFT_208682 [Parasitella parasitica]|nr:hypothetical protein BD408DRAFT_208682 [Parasitella parasitica]